MAIERTTRPNTSPLDTIRALARERVNRTQESQPTSEQAKAAAPAAPRSIEDLRRRLRQLIDSIDVKDSESLGSIREPVLREILLWEFGRDFRQEAQFLPMVDAIGKMLDADPRFHQRFATLVTTLQAR